MHARETTRAVAARRSTPPARGPLSGRDADVLRRLRALSGPLADSLEQALRDLNDLSRLSYVGPAGEVREVMRAAVQLLAPDSEVAAQPWFKGVPDAGSPRPTQAERIRYAIQRQGGDFDQVRDVDELVETLVGKIGRSTYTTGSKAFHAGTVRGRVENLTGWVFAVLSEVLPR